MEKKKTIQCTKMFYELKRVVTPSVENIGRVVCFNHHVTSSKFMECVNRSRRDFGQTESDKAKLNNYCEKVQEFETMVRDNLDSYRIIVYSFINSDYMNVNDFCRKEKIEKDSFNDAVNALILFEDSMYDEYVKVLEERAKKEIEMNTKSGIEIVKLLESGIELENGEVREFDLIDYYELTNIDPGKMLLLLKKVVPSVKLLDFKKFRGVHNNDMTLTNEALNDTINSRIEFNCKTDEKGALLLNTGRVITDEEKLDILHYLVQNDIPVTRHTFFAGIKRIKNNTFYKKDKEVL